MPVGRPETFYVSSPRQIFEDHNFAPNVFIETDFGAMILGLISTGLGVSILPGSYAFSAPPNVRFINLPYKVNLHVAGRKEDKSPIIKNVLQQVQETALKYGLEEN